ncbi:MULTISPECIES: TetR/AcrR family transcriptional regulator [Brachybacterium]|uniref:TetR family transcriptional regulator n=1 Tax=Brachybacterium alimentarium TaxID=47845 RepID=A0A2A3YG93_9MICO|nr:MULTISPECIES: TetR/AcrR family transcriptional regulator [Brachybacterium]PCC38278.1 TetR family transcriptional regulator [Brachybacterium alimentarium]RCS64050.1 TetR/AcrR family transcriptional regulator [Brachybacterium sp. JB7]RCS71905.1 TetR/AcrR family transcriptional regulator [Brachybacterium alimentarium]RCS74265.1 TetR/AcrR family transcriptional regulator [Brachybacterium alimentarium]RCS78224.1 TetR/AcrR family transcriptional regulator [Brachybacterium alimentarium]
MSPEESPAPAAPPVIGRAGSYSKGVARRQEILERAIEVFRDRGADGTSLRRIATAIGVSHAALLHYFDSREQLLVAVYEYAESKRDTAKTYGDSISALEVLVKAAMINVGVPGMVELYTTLVASSLATEGSPANEFFSARFARIRAELTERLQSEQAEGRIRDDVDASDMAALIIAASDGLQIQWLLEPSIELERTLETFAVLFAPRP